MSSEIIAALDKLDALFSGAEKWTKGVYVAPQGGCYCLQGGIDLVCLDFEPTAAFDIREQFRLTLQVPSLSIEWWNDQPHRVFADVKSLINVTRGRLKFAAIDPK